MEKQGGAQHVVVIGLGYVGLPLALLAAERGYTVTGVDIDATKIENLHQAKSYIHDVSEQMLRDTTAVFTDDRQAIAQADIVVICVPTPVTQRKDPDLKPLEGAIGAVARFVQPGTLVAVESTVNPGVCDEVLIPLLESISGLKVGKDVDMVHCPERVNPGDPHWNVRNINRVVGGTTPKAAKRGVAFYKSILDADVKLMGSLKEAEAVKIVENTFRDINIAFVNELAMAFHHLGIDVENVIDGAATKPFAFMAHHPGCGVGGHCIPVDPYYLIDYSQRNGFHHEFLLLARSINERMPAFTVQLLEENLEKQGKTLNGAKVTLLGLAYKADVGDDRESPAYAIQKLLAQKGANLQVYDPFLPAKSTVPHLEAALEHADHVIVAVAHKAFKDIKPETLAKHHIHTVIDGRNMWRHNKQDIAKYGIVYEGIGQSAAPAE